MLLSRKASSYAHPRLQGVLHPDFQHLVSVESQLSGYNACFFCAGISSLGVSKEEYKRITYDTTLAVAQTLARLNPDMVFCYVTGAGTDSTENGLLHLPFRAAYMFRPGFMLATPGQRNVPGLYKFVSWLYPIFRKLTTKYVSTMAEVGVAML